MRILVYNIRHGAGMDRVVDLDRLAAVILPLSPDVVLLQEVDVGVNRSDKADQPVELGRRTGLHPHFGMFREFDGGDYGLGILTREVPLERDHRAPRDEEKPRFSTWVRLEAAIVVSVHLYMTEAERLAQAARLHAAFADAEVPVLVGGDFNSEPDTAVMDFFAQRGWQILPKSGDGLTFPSDTPVKEIDFVMVRPAGAFDVVESRVVDEVIASDHRPVLVELRRRQPPPVTAPRPGA